MMAYERLQQAVEFNPDRSRVTVPRQAVRQVLSHNQRLAAEVERYRVSAALAESMLAERSAKIAEQGGEMIYLRDQCDKRDAEIEAQAERLLAASAGLRRQLEAATDEVAYVTSQLAQAPTWFSYWLGWAMVPAILVGEFVALYYGWPMRHG